MNMGATLTSDRFGSADCAYSFDGTSDYIWVPAAPFVERPFTVSAWVYIEDISKSYILGLGEIGSNDNAKFTIYSTYDEGLRVGSDAAWYYQSDSAYTSTNTWINITVTFDNISTIYYVNGIKYEFLYSVFDIPGSSFPLNNTGFNIGKHTGAGSSKYMKGKIDDLGFWDRALDTTEINALFTMVGVEEISNSLEVSVYPNPAAEFITVSSNQSLSDQEYKIFDPSGKEVKSGILQSNENRIDISNFSDGLYLLFVNGHPAQRFSVLRD
ncbi:MAG: hypothetical protein A2W94_07680 [Bacteroidetes bacterium GWE2_42_42]|nr:MAG: hypothetical protein A2W94_07680 [Bacteroidetes bacterium GWE2_42_42]